MRKTAALLLVLVFLTAPCLIVAEPALSSVDVAEDSWVSKAPMQQARGGLGVAVVNGKIYAIGGIVDNNGGFVGTNEEYDPVTDTWAFKKSMPTPRDFFGVAVYQNKIYCIGGNIKIGVEDGYVKTGITGLNEVYDPATDTWETKASMPTPRSHLTANVVNGKIYLIRDEVNEVYDPATDSWTTKTPNPLEALDPASGVIDNKIYVIGGFKGSESISRKNQIYNPEDDSWIAGASAPQNTVYATAGATTGVMSPKRIYVLGATTQIGVGVNIPDFVNQVYDPENDSWMIGTSIPTSRINLGVAVVNDTLYAIGGHTYESVSISPSAVNEQYTPFGYGTIPPEPFPVVPVAAASVASIAVVGVVLLVYFRKRKR